METPRLLGEGMGSTGSKLFGESDACLTLETALYPPFYSDFHNNQQIEAFKHYEGAGSSEVIRGIGLTYEHDPWSGQKKAH